MVIGGQSTQQFIHNKTKQTLVCQHLFLFAYVVITLHVSTLLLGHLQAYAIQALFTEISMNSYCVHNWF
jgi:hypothetical protein